MSEHLTINREQFGKSCSYYPKLVKIAGGIGAGIFLGYLLEKSEFNRWIDAHSQDIERETGLSVQEQELARKCLKNRNFLQERNNGESLQLSLNQEEIQEKLQLFDKLIFPSLEQETDLTKHNLAEKASDRFFAATRQAANLNITPNYRFEGPWHSQEQFENFQKALLEHFKRQSFANPMAYVVKIIDGMTKGIVSPFWEEFAAGKTLGSSQIVQQEWEIEPGVPYPAFLEEIVQYYIHKGEPIEAATAKAHRELKYIDRAKSWWQGFLRKCDRLADEAIKAKKLGLKTPYLPPSFSIKSDINKQQVMEKLLFIHQQHSVPISPSETEFLSQTDSPEKSKSSPVEIHSPALSILQKAYNTNLGRTYIARQIAAHPEWGYQIIDDKIVDLYPF